MLKHLLLFALLFVQNYPAVNTAAGTCYGCGSGSGVLGKMASLNLNQTNTDNALSIVAAKYLVRKVTVTNCSTTLGVSAATVGVFTSTGGGGTTIVALGLLTTLTASSKYADMTLALTTDTLTASTIQVRNGVTHGSAATCDVYIIGDVMP